MKKSHPVLLRSEPDQLRTLQRLPLRWVFVVLVSFLLSGCILAPFIDSFKQVGATSSDRQALLSKEVKRFNDAMFWGTPGPIMELVDAPALPKIQDQVAAADGKERVVESRVAKIDFDEDAYAATVNVRVRYYRIPFYVVQERQETQEWKFSLGTGWRLADRSLNERAPNAALSGSLQSDGGSKSGEGRLG